MPQIWLGESHYFLRDERERKKKLSFFFLSFLEVNLMYEHFRQPAISKSSHGEERTLRCHIHVKSTRKRIYSLGYVSLTQPAFCKVWNRTKDEGVPVSHSTRHSILTALSCTHMYQKSQTKGKTESRVLNTVHISTPAVCLQHIEIYVHTHVYTYMNFTLI